MLDSANTRNCPWNCSLRLELSDKREAGRSSFGRRDSRACLNASSMTEGSTENSFPTRS